MTVTNDLDICYDPALDNLDRLARTLLGLNATPVGPVKNPRFQLDTESLRQGATSFETEFGALKVIGTPPGTSGYEAAAGRPKDRIELEVLGALREELG